MISNRILTPRLNKFLKTTLYTLASTLVLSTASADILYTSDFETNDKVISRSSYAPMFNNGNSPTIVTAEKGITPREGSHMMKSYLNRFTSGTNYRTEAALTNPYKGFSNLFKKQQEYWVASSVFIPRDWDMDYGGKKKDGTPTEKRLASGIILQFHDRSFNDKKYGAKGSWRDGLTLVVSHDSRGFKIYNRDHGCRDRVACKNNPKVRNGNKLKIFSQYAPMKRGQWNDFVFNLKFSPNSDGFIKVWVNGELQVDEKGPNHYSEFDAKEYPYFKMGLYQAQYKLSGWSKDVKWNVNERTIYHDELRIGNSNSSYAEVLPTGARAINDCKLDVDGNANSDALTDGLLFQRHMFGIHGDALTQDAVANDCTRCTAPEIQTFLNQCTASSASDIDGNGTVDALTDGLLIFRHLVGSRDAALIEDSVANDCTRCTATEIGTYLKTLVP